MQGEFYYQGRQNYFSGAKPCDNIRLQEGSQNHPVLLHHLFLTSWFASQITEGAAGAWR